MKQSSKERALVLLSGGMDSATCAFMAKEKYDELATLFFRYGQRTENREIESFLALSERLGASHKEIFLLPFYKKIGKNALTDTSLEIPAMDIAGVIPNTYVPFRNGVMLSIAAAWAEAHDYGNIFIGAVWEDSSGYPDCREKFLKAMQNAVNNGTSDDFSLTLHYPVIHMQKDEIILEGIKLGVPFDFTWSCYQGSEKPCGRCPSCHLRQKAFEKAGIKDPLL